MTVGVSLLEINDLKTVFPSDIGPLRAVDGASFSVAAGERVGIVGESGSGKSVTALSIMGLIRTPPASVSGKVVFKGVDLLKVGSKQRQRVRGGQIGMIFQNPLNCLNPVMTIGHQIVETILAHEEIPKAEARDRAISLLQRVGIPDPSRSVDEYPHKFSGGMRQRVMIAMALSCQPDLLIADEPTTALDVTIQAQIVDLLMSICEEENTAVVFITHDLAILAGFAERVLVMYSGRIVEEGPVDTIYYGATHPYTWGLMTSITRLDESRQDRLSTISGNPPSAVFQPSGCPFHPRCRYAEEICPREIPALVVHKEDDHPSACHFAGALVPPARLRQVQQ